jgi:osmoprotectant transport system ATP-binding protein
VAENVAVVPRLLGWDARRIVDRTAELLDLVRLPRSFASRKPHQLSGGEAQRVGVARALAADPPVLLMDEPFGALDALTREALQGEFQRIQKDLRKTVLFVTHDVAEAVRLADNIIVMQGGRIAGQGAPGNLADTLKGSYIQEFLGSRLGIELLARIPAIDRADFSRDGIGDGIAAAGEEGIDMLEPHATLLDALSRMVTTGVGCLYLRREGGALGRIDFTALIRPASTEPGA